MSKTSASPALLKAVGSLHSTRVISRTRAAISKHVQKILDAVKRGARVSRPRTLKERTGLNFGSGITRKFQRAHAKRALRQTARH